MNIIKSLLGSLSHSSLKEGSLSHKVVKGGAWIFGLRMSRRLLDFLRTVILAHFLAPKDFGLMGIAILTLQTLEAFSQTGFESALVQKKEDIKGYLNVAWTVLALRGIFLVVIISAFAPFVAKFFNIQESGILIRVLGFSFLLQGFTNIGIVFFQKELEFRKQYLYDLSGIVFDFVLSVILVFILRSVWALIIGKICGSVVRLIASYLLSSYRPRFEFDRNKFHELHNFGRWVSGVNIVTYIATQGDSILVGKIFGPAALGVYKLGSTISNMPTTEITSVVSQVAFPAYAKVQNNRERLRASFLKTLFFIGLLSSLLTSLIYVFIPDFTKIFLGEKWISIVPIVQVLVIAGFIRSITAIPGPIFQAIGKPHVDTYSQAIRLIGLLTPIYPLSKVFGLIGVAYSILISITCMSFYSFFRAAKILDLKTKTLLKTLFAPVISGIAVILSVMLIGHRLNHSSLINLAVLVPISFVVFFGSVILQEYLNPEYKLTSFLATLLN